MTEMTTTRVQKLERIFVLEDEIMYAQTCILPSATGHIHTSINWMKHRLEQLKKELELEDA
jgi:flagellar biosynthesis/type III secretory pathway protein FliH|tara:strand:- start:1350 stop:1532 length:183 start_codon:yes stop_codon:yes gene_type:complete